MEKTLLTKLLVGFVLMGFAGCKLSKDDKDIVVKVDPEFSIGMFEELNQTRDFQLTFETVENQSCSSNIINFFSDKKDRSLTLNLNEIVEVENCQTGSGVAGGHASFDYLPTGIYNLELNLKNALTSTGKLTVSNEMYSLDLEQGNGFVAKIAELMRIPQSTIWGYVAYKQSQQSTDAQAFLTDLNAKTNALSLSKGNFGYFSVDQNGKLSLNNTPDYNNIKTFYRTQTGVKSDIETLLSDYRAQFQDGSMEFKVFTWEGEML